MLNPNFVVSKIYHSREDRVAELHAGNERLQYDSKDGEKVDQVADVVDEYTGKFCEAMDNYIQSYVNDEPEEIDYARRNAIECWALAQAALSKAAWVMRFDGNKAYERMINALKTGAAADMRGL